MARIASKLKALAGGLLASASLCAAAQEGLNFSGSYRNLLLASRTAAGAGYTLDLNRLRLQAQGALTRSVALDLQYDNELLLGRYLGTDEFRAVKDLPPPQYRSAQASYLDTARAYGLHRLHRAALTFTAGRIDVRVGRQRIAWGTGRFFSPLDILNPVSPTALEREERLGVDALLAEAKLGALSRLSLVYAPQRDARLTSRAALWHGNARGVDFSLAGGRLRGQDMVGLDMAGQVGAAGIRAEATRQRPEGAAAFTRLMIGLDYAWPSTLTLSGELYYNGGGSRHVVSAPAGSLLSGRLPGRATRYAGLYAGIEITPVLKWTNHLVWNADDHSRALDTRLTWSVQQDLDLTMGLQRFDGAAGSEFALHDLLMLQLQWFF